MNYHDKIWVTIRHKIRKCWKLENTGEFSLRVSRIQLMSLLITSQLRDLRFKETVLDFMPHRFWSKYPLEKGYWVSTWGSRVLVLSLAHNFSTWHASRGRRPLAAENPVVVSLLNELKKKRRRSKRGSIYSKYIPLLKDSFCFTPHRHAASFSPDSLHERIGIKEI